MRRLRTDSWVMQVFGWGITTTVQRHSFCLFIARTAWGTLHCWIWVLLTWTAARGPLGFWSIFLLDRWLIWNLRFLSLISTIGRTRLNHSSAAFVSVSRLPLFSVNFRFRLHDDSVCLRARVAYQGLVSFLIWIVNFLLLKPWFRIRVRPWFRLLNGLRYLLSGHRDHIILL